MNVRNICDSIGYMCPRGGQSFGRRWREEWAFAFAPAASPVKVCVPGDKLAGGRVRTLKAVSPEFSHPGEIGWGYRLAAEPVVR